ncbi:MAG: hypothetical protein ACOYMW_01100 [Candidatus Competibacteraceae bacterium]|jgi:hypothetical protein
MSKKSIPEIVEDSPPITQTDIDSGRLILRQRKVKGTCWLWTGLLL